MKNDIGGLQQEIQSTIWSRGLIGNYEIVRKIGEGSFSSVFLAIHVMTRHEVVLKSAEKFQSNLASEISNMSLLSHPHIVRLYEYIVMPDKVWLVLEYCGGQELFNHLVMSKVIVPSHACRLFAQLAGAVAYAHQLHCAHRDLKLENVLLDEEGNIKLGDFGFTRSYVPRTMLETVCGTESYMAPELLLHQKYNPEAADVWSLGVILYALIYGKLPFDEDNTAETVNKIVEEDPPFPHVPKGEYLVEIARKMLRKQPNQRPKVIEMLDELKDPGKQQKQLLVKIMNYPESSYIFSSKEERTVLKGMKALSIDLHNMASSIVHHKCDPLHGLWYTALDRQRILSKQVSVDSGNNSTSALHRRKSKASIRSAKSFNSQKKGRSNGAVLRHEIVGETSVESPAADVATTHDAESEDEGSHKSVAVASIPPLSPQHQHQQIQFQVQAQQNQQQQQQQQQQLQPEPQQHKPLLVEPGSEPQPPVREKNRVHSRINEFIDRRSTGKPRRTMEKIISALKIRRNNDKETLMAYYNPEIDGRRSSRASLSGQTTNSNAQIGSESMLTTPSKSSNTPSRGGGLHINYQTPVSKTISSSQRRLNSPSIGPNRSSPPSSRRHSTLSLASSNAVSYMETPHKNSNGSGGEPGGSSAGEGTDHAIYGSNLQSVSTPSLSINMNPSNQSSQTSQSSPQINGSNSGNPGGASMSRQMSTYSQISQVSQLSQSSVEPSQLMTDANESPKSNNRNPNSSLSVAAARWSSNTAWKYAGMAQPSNIVTSSSTPPGTPLLSRPRAAGRLISVKEKIPSKIDEGENETEW